MRCAISLAFVALACRPEPAPEGPPPTAGEQAEPIAATTSAAEEPLPSGAGSMLSVRNHGGASIEIYGAYLVDRAGDLGTRALWPHPSDCPDVPLPPRKVPEGALLGLPTPTEAYADGSCTPSPLPAGDYVLRLESGYGEGLYAADAITLPLAAPVELEMRNHEEGPPCDEALARRAAKLAFAAVDDLPPEWKRECDVAKAKCGTLPLEVAMPPPKCTVTLHERLLRVARAAGNDTPRALEAWTDFEVVYVQRPDITRTSASKVEVDGKFVVIAGSTSHHRHEHGGDAAKVGAATFIVHNPHPRRLRMRVTGIEFLNDGQCGLPNEVLARPKPDADAPKEFAPGQSEIVVGFTAQGAYQAHCDRFATRVTFEVEGKTIAATAEHEVMRFEPMRR